MTDDPEVTHAADADGPTTPYPLLSTEEIYRGRVVTLRRDTLLMDDGSRAVREIVAHPGAVVIVAVDEDDQVVLVHQYRHPVQARLAELPAGLLDIDGEAPLDGARRELAEEALLQASDWHVLLDLYSSPGFTDEAIRVYLARGLRAAPRPDGFVVEAEETGMTITRLPLRDAVTQALRGDIRNAVAAAGILAAWVAREADWQGLRSPTAPWHGRRRP